ncbi:MAG: formyltransferase family protein [archaeon]
MPEPVKIFDPESRSGPMRIACFMSGSGTNVVKIIEKQLSNANRKYEVVLVFTDVEDETKCNAKRIADKFGIPFTAHDIKKFYDERGHPSKSDMSLRPCFDKESVEMIDPYDIDLVALGGYMSVLTRPIIEQYDGKVINVHPADLSIAQENRRKFVGLHAVRDAILAGERQICSTTHVVREKVDYGEILMISKPVAVSLPPGSTLDELRKAENRKLLGNIVEENQKRLKEHGDWVILPKTLELIGEGLYALDGRGNVYLNNKLLPTPLRL